jgi:hypothetical protein
LRAAGEIETAQKNIQDWLELDEGELFSSALLILFIFQFVYFLSFLIFYGYLLLHFSGLSLNLDDLPQLILINECLLHVV